MSAASFSFPPPPPPPPSEPLAPTPSNDSYSRGRGDKRWDRGSRGRGRGQNQRGFRGGNYHGSYGAGNGNHHGGGSYPLPTYPPVQQPQYSFNPAASQYPPIANYHVPPPTFSYYPTTHQVAQPQAPSYQFAAPPQFSQTHGYPHQPQHGRPHHPSNRYESPPVAMGPPIRMGFSNEYGRVASPIPPTPNGFPENSISSERADPRPSFQEDPPFRHQRGRGRGRSPGRYQGGRGHHSSRGRQDTGNSLKESSRPTQVAPAVPQFGNPLPVKPPSPQLPPAQVEAKKIKKKKKRRVNQLGLTPKAEEHVSSSEEEDEEAKLAARVGPGITGQQYDVSAPLRISLTLFRLQFTYRGQTSTLQSSTDIASWIEERKKQFPTAARKAEKDAIRQKVREEREEKRRAQLAEKRAGRLRVRQQRTLDKDKQAAAEKAKLKVEKLRKRLEKEERRIAKAESKTLKRSASPDVNVDQSREVKRARIQPQDDMDESADPSVKAEPRIANSIGEIVRTEQPSDGVRASVGEVQDQKVASSIPDPLTPTSQPALPEEELEGEVKVDPIGLDSSKDQDQVLGRSATGEHKVHATGDISVKKKVGDATISDASLSSDDDSDDSDEDLTSSSGSGSTSASDSDVDAPETASTRREGPQKRYAVISFKVDGADEGTDANGVTRFLSGARRGQRKKQLLPDRSGRACING
ncbi:MAG: hypothetical protein Q9202_006577 [Teloschistes flavicans]